MSGKPLRKDGQAWRGGWKCPQLTKWDIWSKVKIGLPEECWPWQGFVMKRNGYGQATYLAKNWRAHRLIYILYHDVSLTPDQFLLHSCDNRLCCNPHHMRIGTHQDNMDDMKLRKRSYKGRVPWIEANAIAGITPKVFRRRVGRLGWTDYDALTTPLLPTGVARGQIIRKG